MATNDFLVIAPGPTPNVASQATYAADPIVTTGNLSGVAKSAIINKGMRQSSIMAAVLAQFIADTTGQNSVDDGTTAVLLANLKTSLLGRLISKRVLSATGNYTPTVGTRLVHIRMWGGGGGGQASTTAIAAAGGGGAGYLEWFGPLSSLGAGPAYPYVIGTLGNPGSASGQSGATGGTSSVASTILVARGGIGGGIGGIPGAGGTTTITVSGGLLNLTGLSGQSQFSNAIGGGGGTSFGGMSGVGSLGSLGSGGGGGAPTSGGAFSPGGAGGAGLIIIEEYL